MAIIPSRYQDADIEKLPKVLRDAIDDTKNTKGKGIFICGGTGTGKTYALYAMSKKYDIKVENWIDIMEDIKSKMSNNQSVGDLIDSLTSEKFLAIDDVGAENQTNYSQEKFYMIVNRIYNRMSRLFISTNLTLEQFQDKYGERLFSRIAEMCEIVELTGEDKRLN